LTTLAKYKQGLVTFALFAVILGVRKKQTGPARMWPYANGRVELH